YNTGGQPVVDATILVAPDRRSVSLTPNVLLLPYSYYCVQLVYYSYSDPAGNVGSGLGDCFYTGGATDSSAPSVVSVTPANASTGVPVNSRVVAVMREPHETPSVGNGSIQLTPAVAGTASLGNDLITVTFTLLSPLSTSTGYSVAIAGL